VVHVAGMPLAAAEAIVARVRERCPAAQIPGVATNLEEWAHEEYFCSGKSTPVVVIASVGCAEEFAPAVCAVPLSLLGCFIAMARGKKSCNFPGEQAESWR
jgi:hypothetical protein